MLSPGTLLSSRYKIESVLGQGGMGAVYLATMEALGNKRVAVKEMELKGFSSDELAQAVIQFKKEASFLANLEHPNLVQVTDFFIEDDKHYLVMAYVTGETLQQKLKQEGRPFAWNRVKALAQPLIDVLHYLHTQTPPILFRDLKPSNIMVEESGRLRLIDFGIARTAQAGDRTSTFLQGTGTSGFSPIEQYGGGQSTDQRSDIYALGATLYYMLTGKIPPDAVARISQGAKLIPPTELQPTLPKAVDSLLSKSLEVRQSDRHASMVEFKNELMAIDQLESESPTENCLEAPDPVPAHSRVEENRPAAIMVEMFPTTNSRQTQQSFWPWIAGAASLTLAGFGLVFAVNHFTPTATDKGKSDNQQVTTATSAAIVSSGSETVERSGTGGKPATEEKAPAKPETVTRTTQSTSRPKPTYYEDKPIQTRVVRQSNPQPVASQVQSTTTRTATRPATTTGSARYPKAEKYPKAQSAQPAQQPQQQIVIVREPQQPQQQAQPQGQPPPQTAGTFRSNAPRDRKGRVIYDPNRPIYDRSGNRLPPPPDWDPNNPGDLSDLPGPGGPGGPGGGPGGPGPGQGEGRPMDGPPGYNSR